MKSIAAITIAIVTSVVMTGCRSRNAGMSARTQEPTLTAGNPTDEVIRKFEARLKERPNDLDAMNKLGSAYCQKGRESGVLDWYVMGKKTFEQAVNKDGNDPVSLRNLAYCSTIFHNFKGAIEMAKRATTVNPNDPFPWGVLADSYIELGQYESAISAAQHMADLRPDLASYSRASRLRYILGDNKGAMLLMQKAINCGSPFAENTAWCRVQLGDLYFKSGAIPAAEQQYKLALERFKDYRHGLQSMGRVLYAQGKTQEAVKMMEKSCSIGTPPIPYLVELGDLYSKLGRKDDAERAFARVDRIVSDYRSHGIEGDELMVSMFYSDHDRNLGEALKLAESEINEHTSIEAYATLAWAYYKSGRPMDAKVAIEKSLKTGVHDPLIDYRASKIYEAAGDVEKSRRYALDSVGMNPHFSIQYGQSAKLAMQTR